MTRLALSAFAGLSLVAQVTAVQDEAAAVTRWLGTYDAAFNAKDLDNLASFETKVTMLPGGQAAYATSRYTLKAKMGERDIDSEGLGAIGSLQQEVGCRRRR